MATNQSATAQDITDELISGMPEGFTDLMDMQDPDGPGPLFAALGEVLATVAIDRLDDLRDQLTQAQRMPISVTGSFISVGITLRPGCGYAVRGVNASDYVDQLLHCDELNLPGEMALAALEQISEPEGWLLAMEAMIRMLVAEPGVAQPEPISARFEELAFTNPSASIADFAQCCGITQRQLERIIRRDFGLPPKQVLRRARALDMASHLRGVADKAEAEELMLRYYDQSHLIREFTQLFGMSPKQFAARPQPILTLALESRQARRLELIERLEPGAVRPWQ